MAIFLPYYLYANESAIEEDLLTLKELQVSGPYCGVYSLMACLDTFDLHPDIRDFLTLEYVGSSRGSNIEELVNAVESQGLHARAYSNLTWRELEKATSPTILHYRSTFADEQYNHWVAFVGVENGCARIIDIPHPMTTIPFAELLAKWDGIAISVSDKPIRGKLLLSSRIHYLTIVGILFSTAFCIQYFFWNRNKEPFFAEMYSLRLRRAVTQTFVFLSTLFIAAILYHVFSPIGFLRNTSAVAEVTRRYYSVDIPEIFYNEMATIVDDQSCLLIDARYPKDFKQGTIPGAKNMAISSSLFDRQQLLQGIDKNSKIVVFCQSRGCGYVDEIANFLKFNGYSNVILYRGGYREWNKR